MMCQSLRQAPRALLVAWRSEIACGSNAARPLVLIRELIGWQRPRVTSCLDALARACAGTSHLVNL